MVNAVGKVNFVLDFNHNLIQAGRNEIVKHIYGEYLVAHILCLGSVVATMHFHYCL